MLLGIKLLLVLHVFAVAILIVQPKNPRRVRMMTGLVDFRAHHHRHLGLAAPHLLNWNHERGLQALRHGAAWLDLSARGRIMARGRDRARLLHNVTSNDVKGLTPGAGCYAFLLSPQGRIQADLYLLCVSRSLPDRYRSRSCAERCSSISCGTSSPTRWSWRT